MRKITLLAVEMKNLQVTCQLLRNSNKLSYIDIQVLFLKQIIVLNLYFNDQ